MRGILPRDEFARIDLAFRGGQQPSGRDLARLLTSHAALVEYADELAAVKGRLEALVERWRASASHLGSFTVTHATAQDMFRLTRCADELEAALHRATRTTPIV